jgi:LEA14-like dessication related protein
MDPKRAGNGPERALPGLVGRRGRASFSAPRTGGRPSRARIAAFAASLAAVSVSGCALFFENPTVSIANVRVVSVTLVGGTAEASLNVVNPNGFTLTAKEVRYRLSFADDQAEGGWRTLTEGESDGVVQVAARDSAAVRLELPFSFADVGRALGSLLGEGQLSYRLDGDVKFDAGIKDVRVPFDRRGSLAP